MQKQQQASVIVEMIDCFCLQQQARISTQKKKKTKKMDTW
jgi:hypothetical protein